MNRKKQKNAIPDIFPEAWDQFLKEKVLFYRKLDDTHKERFKKKTLSFLRNTTITGVELEVTDELRLFVAASAIIPVFNFQGWEYLNLGEVLIYKGLVETRQAEENEQKDILGQVRPFQSGHILLLSKESLERGFEAMNGKENVGFHEFSHLIDEADGQIDGLPRALMPEPLLRPWTELMYKEIERIKKGQSDINPYGLTNHAEFFAVVCEYFFENPQKFHHKHPELFAILDKTFGNAEEESK